MAADGSGRIYVVQFQPGVLLSCSLTRGRLTLLQWKCFDPIVFSGRVEFPCRCAEKGHHPVTGGTPPLDPEAPVAGPLEGEGRGGEGAVGLFDKLKLDMWL